MEPVRLTRIGTAHPPYVLDQEAAATRIEQVAGGGRRLHALARGTRIRTRSFVLPPDEIAELGSIAERNAIYRREAPALARAAVCDALARTVAPGGLAALVTSSCTGYALPGWGSRLVDELGLPCDTMRLPITEAGCAGGVVAIARAADHLRTRPGRSAIAAATELCSLAFHADNDEGNLVATLIFADGAGAALLASGPGEGLEILDSSSMLVPGTSHLLGFDLTDRGFYPVLARELPDTVVPAAGRAISRLIARHGLTPADIGAWLIHPGGARILSGIESGLSIDRSRMRWSWESMAEHGNTSSAAIFDVLRRYFEDLDAPHGPAVVAAFGPGVAIELLLVDRRC